jgi:hypothetical protein
MRRQTYQNIRCNIAQFQSITGLSLSCFDALFLYFEEQWNKYAKRYTIGGKERLCPPRIYKNKVFEDIPSMLVFILYYLKNNCLQDAHAAMFGMSQPQSNLWIHLLKDILLKSLKASKSLPCRDFESLQKILTAGQDVLIDGSERPVPRPSDNEVQKEYYSGKKTHTVKNILITSMIKKVLYLSPTYEVLCYLPNFF